MAAFHVHADIQNENAINRNKKKFVSKNIKRQALQPLGNIQQYKNHELVKLLDQETKVDEKKCRIEAPGLIQIPPVLRRRAAPYPVKDILERDYQEEIWMYLRHLEQSNQRVKPTYMKKQPSLTWEMRSILVDWLVSVADEYKMNNSTLHLSVNYIDRFLSNLSVIREKFQLVGASSMMVAAKMEEVYPPETKEWAYLCGDAFTISQFNKMEHLVLRILKFEMNSPTILDFINHLCTKHHLDHKTMYLAQYLSELILLEGEEYLEYFPSKLAAACLALARFTLNKPEPWSKTLEATAGYTLKQLSPVVQKQQKTFKSSPFKEQQAIQKKYTSEKYQKVALIRPRILVLEEEE